MNKDIVRIFLCLVALISFVPNSYAGQPKRHASPSISWLLGAWVYEGGKCSEGASVFLEGGRLGFARSDGKITTNGSYALRGNMLTRTVPSERGGNLVDEQRIHRVSANEMAADYPHNTNPDIGIPPMRRCPVQAGPEPWHPEVRFKGISAYKMVGR